MITSVNRQDDFRCAITFHSLQRLSKKTASKFTCRELVAWMEDWFTGSPCAGRLNVVQVDESGVRSRMNATSGYVNVWVIWQKADSCTHTYAHRQTEVRKICMYWSLREWSFQPSVSSVSWWSIEIIIHTELQHFMSRVVYSMFSDLCIRLV